MRQDAHSRAWWRILTRNNRTLDVIRETGPTKRELRVLCDIAETALDDPAYQLRHPELDRLAA